MVLIILNINNNTVFQGLWPSQSNVNSSHHEELINYKYFEYIDYASSSQTHDDASNLRVLVILAGPIFLLNISRNKVKT